MKSRWSGKLGRLYADVDLNALPIPRVSVTLHPDYERSLLSVGVRLADNGGGDDLARLELYVPWRRPRPWELDLEWPPRFYQRQRFRWRPGP